MTPATCQDGTFDLALSDILDGPTLEEFGSFPDATSGGEQPGGYTNGGGSLDSGDTSGLGDGDDLFPTPPGLDSQPLPPPDLPPPPPTPLEPPAPEPLTPDLGAMNRKLLRHADASRPCHGAACLLPTSADHFV